MTIESPYKSTIPASAPEVIVDLDSADELSIRSLLLGIVHRTAGEYIAARAFLVDAHARQPDLTISTWVGGIAQFELAVLELKEAEVSVVSLPSREAKAVWTKALEEASGELDRALALAMGNNSDLSSRLDTRIAMLKDEIAMKREIVGGL